MIRVNLIESGRPRTPKKPRFQAAQKLAVGCSLILATGALVIGWRFAVLTKESKQLDRGIAKALEDTARLHSIIEQEQQFEQRRAQLQQRLALIDQLRKGQTGPVHMLDQISRALPSMVWLTELKQTENANEVLIEGKCMSVTGLPDFAANLEASGYFKKSVDIVSSQTETAKEAPNGLVKFVIRAQFQPPSGS